MKQAASGEDGFTLIEILAAIVILSAVSLTMTGFFMNALSYAKGNQNKTVMVNLARNALFYMEKESFDPVQAYFLKDGHPLITPENCAMNDQSLFDCSVYSETVRNTQTLAQVLRPEINGIEYLVTIEYQPRLLDSAKPESRYLLPVLVKVKSSDSGRKRDIVEVEGYITDEAIR
ncbi:PulJ/GspJ family protein [Paenibacillus nasutitermitis]|uniref:Prepilin-type N-terminal cleavage/methylation domain-containing protein n=1 Tax=Paenibacillus nasutitermitis TaxID=1652958 RepID=A0A916YIY3_9BACL|nr:type II secretion system protein [Paenibacillus nasutitermitis]GGD47952.1 hypothetical protein GCM10010911_01860 [Paenibacillus nasutitermitis]